MLRLQVAGIAPDGYRFHQSLPEWNAFWWMAIPRRAIGMIRPLFMLDVTVN